MITYEIELDDDQIKIKAREVKRGQEYAIGHIFPDDFDRAYLVDVMGSLRLAVDRAGHE